jgi:hypothetical protein
MNDLAYILFSMSENELIPPGFQNFFWFHAVNYLPEISLIPVRVLKDSHLQMFLPFHNC